MKRIVINLIAMVSVLVALLGVSATTASASPVTTANSYTQAAAPAAMVPAVSGYCGNGRCQINLSNYETWLVGQFRAPAPPAWVPWQLQAAYRASAWAHAYIARSYASRGYCSAFVLDIRPWANQGFMARHC